jgi:hypothetical protein
VARNRADPTWSCINAISGETTTLGGILFQSREGALVWLRAPRASNVPSRLRESMEATNPPGSVA